MGNCISSSSVEPAVIIQPWRRVDFKNEPALIPKNAVRKLSQYYKYSGGLADVWECSWRQTCVTGNVKVAVKSIRVPSTEDETLIMQTQRDIRREAHVWMQLEHDNILKFYGIVEGFGVLPAFVSPWIENGSLDNYLTKRRSSNLSAVEVFNMLKQIAAGLQYLHDTARIVHGDLTCTNILMSDDGRLYLADFGLSMILEEAQNATFNSTHAGNMRWIAPERLPEQGESTKPTKPADIYSYGCIMLQLLSGRQPYSWLKQATAVSRARIDGTEPFRTNEIAHVNDDHKRYSLGCLSRDLRNRPNISQIVTFLRTSQ